MKMKSVVAGAASMIAGSLFVSLLFGFTNLVTQPNRHPTFGGTAASGTALCLGNVGNSGTDPFSNILCSNANTGAGTGNDLTTQAPVNTTGTGITSNHTGWLRPWVNQVTVTNTALTAAGATDVTLMITGSVTRIIRVLADVTQVFTGGTLSAMTVTCGNVAGGNQYLLSGSVFAAQTTLGDIQAEIGAGLLSATLADFGTSGSGIPGGITVTCRFTCTGANCSAATQGVVTFYVEGVTYPL